MPIQLLMLKDPLVRRFISGSLFAAAFVWVAVSFFEVDPEVVWVFLLLSSGFVFLLVIAGLIGAPVIALFNRKPPMLSQLEESDASNPGSEEID